MRTVTAYRVTAGRGTIECRDEKSAFEVAAKLTDSTHPSYSGSHTAQVDIVHSDGVWWTLGTANWGKPFKFPPPHRAANDSADQSYYCGGRRWNHEHRHRL